MKKIGMEKEESYQKTMEAEMQTLGAQVIGMQEEAERVGGEIKMEFNQCKEALRLKQTLASQRLENLKYVTGDIWKGFIEEFENAITDLKESITKVHPNMITEVVVGPINLPFKPAV